MVRAPSPLYSTGAHLPRPRLPSGADARGAAAHLCLGTFVRRGAQRVHQPASTPGPAVKAARRHGGCGRGAAAVARSGRHRTPAARHRGDPGRESPATSFLMPAAVTVSTSAPSLARPASMHTASTSPFRQFTPRLAATPVASGSWPMPIDLCPTPAARSRLSCRSRGG